MNIIQKQLILLLTFSANILLPTTHPFHESITDIISKIPHFRATHPELVKQYEAAREIAENSPSYREYNSTGHTLKNYHKQIISRAQALQHVWSGALPLRNVILNKLSVTDFYDNCERTRHFGTPQCLLYNQLATEFSEKHAQLLSQYSELQKAYFESEEGLKLNALAEQVKTEYKNQICFPKSPEN